MFSKFSRSWQLVKASASVLRQDKALLVFPAVSSLAALLVAITFIVPMVLMVPLTEVISEDESVSIGFWIWLFVFYLTQYFVMFFFNTALVGAAMIRLEGGQPTLGAGLQVAMSRVGAIFIYAVMAATVGLILRMIEERLGFIGRMVVGLIGLAWTVATFLVVPVLVTRNVSAVEAVKESTGLLKKTWGENLIGQGGIGLAFGFIQAGLIFATVALAALAGMVGGLVLAITVLVAGGLAVLLAALIQTALSAIYAAALYRFATGQPNPEAFDAGMLQDAFQVKA
jgi:hypothetical protein